MKHKTIFITFLLIFAFILPVFAQKRRVKSQSKVKTINFSKIYESEWILYAASDSNNYYYNPAKASRKGSLVRIWSVARGEATDEKVNTIWYEINCSSDKIRSLAGVEYLKKNVIYVFRRSSWDTPKAKFTAIIPESIGEALKEEACSLNQSGN